MARQKVPEKVQTHVLVSSRRRCCLCVYLDGELSVKRGQIAHLDGDRNNNKVDNLAFLCLRHHDEYDSKTSQSKGITRQEIESYRDRLHTLYSSQESQLSVQQYGDDGTLQLSNTSDWLIGEILNAYDRDSLALTSRHRTNGIRLLRLGSIALEEYGDFVAAKEAAWNLLKLVAQQHEREKRWPFLSSKELPNANSYTSLLSLVAKGMNIDWQFWLSLRMDFREQSLLDGKRRGSDDAFANTPSIHCIGWAHVLTELSRSGPVDWRQNELGNAIGELLLSAGLLLNFHGLELPAHFGKLHVGLAAERVTPEDQSVFQSIHEIAARIAFLPEPAYRAALKSIAYKDGVTEIHVDDSSDSSSSLWKKGFLTSHIFPHGIMLVAAGSDEQKLEMEAQLSEYRDAGERVCKSLTDFIEEERRLTLEVYNGKPLFRNIDERPSNDSPPSQTEGG